MPEDTKAGMIQGFLDSYKGNMVCSKMLYKEALNHPFDEPKQWEIREINDIMNNSIVGWKQFTNPRHRCHFTCKALFMEVSENERAK